MLHKEGYAMYEIVDNKLVAMKYVPSPNIGRALTPTLVVMHYTASTGAASPLSWLTSPKSKVSAHLLIGTDGDVSQLVPFNRQAWHAGQSHWDGREHVNQFSIGIELVNPGPLKASNNGFCNEQGYVWPFGTVHERHPNHTFSSTDWAAYPEQQINVLTSICVTLRDCLNIHSVAGHQDITHRKPDPGPAFPMAHFIALFASGRPDTILPAAIA